MSSAIEQSGLDIPARDIFAEMDNMSSGIAIYDKDLKLLFANKAIRNYLPDLYAALDAGMTVEEGIIAQARLIYPDMTDSALKERARKICEIIQSGGTLEVNTPSGIRLSSDYHKTARNHYVVITQDITKRVKYVEQLGEARLKAEQANKAKTEFLADMSHEIRTPLSGVFMSAQLLQQQLSLLNQPELSSLSDILVSSANHLSAIINDVLDLSKIEAGQVDIKLANNSLFETLSNLKKSQDKVAQEVNVDLILVMDPNLPERLVFDAVRVRQCVTNLVSNALKFTKQGSVTIAAMFDPQTYGVTIHVADTGVGIAPEELSQVFDHFAQAKKDIYTGQKSTGLGLAISRKLARLMGGDITLTSELGTGSIFTLTFNSEPPALLEDNPQANAA